MSLFCSGVCIQFLFNWPHEHSDCVKNAINWHLSLIRCKPTIFVLFREWGFLSNLLLCHRIATGREWASSSPPWLGRKPLVDPEIGHREWRWETQEKQTTSARHSVGINSLYSRNLGRDYLQRRAADGSASQCDAPTDQTPPSDRTCSSSMGPLWWRRGPHPDRRGGRRIPHRNTWAQDAEKSFHSEW